MSKKEIKYRDPVVEKVVNKFTSRSDVGFKKYGVTLRDDPGNLFTWLNHLQEELMDGILYIERAKEEFTAAEGHAAGTGPSSSIQAEHNANAISARKDNCTKRRLGSSAIATASEMDQAEGEVLQGAAAGEEQEDFTRLLAAKPLTGCAH